MMISLEMYLELADDYTSQLVRVEGDAEGLFFLVCFFLFLASCG